MVKKIIILICIILLIIILFFVLKPGKKYTKTIDNTFLMNHEKYKHITADNIKKIEITRYTEAGGNTSIIEDLIDINKAYNYLAGKKLGKETQMACEDNTTIYRFTLNDGSTTNIEIECDWVIIDKKRYLIN